MMEVPPPPYERVDSTNSRQVVSAREGYSPVHPDHLRDCESSGSSFGGKDRSSDIVHVNVGGVIFTTQRSTLCAQPGTKIAEIFGANPPQLGRDDHGRLFLDRDGSLFCIILEYLRSTRLVTHDNFDKYEKLEVEAEYYGLYCLAEAARGRNKKKTSKPKVIKEEVKGRTLVLCCDCHRVHRPVTPPGQVPMGVITIQPHVTRLRGPPSHSGTRCMLCDCHNYQGPPEVRSVFCCDCASDP